MPHARLAPPALLALALASVAPQARAVDATTLGVGIADSHDGESTRVIEGSFRWKSDGSIKLIDEYELLVGHIDDRPLPALGRDVIYVGFGTRKNFGRWFLGGGIAAVDNTSEALSSWYQFVTTGGVKLGERASLTLRHLSNSGFRGRNRGETFINLGWEW